MKVTIITVVYNAATTIKACLSSVIDQTYPHVEYIVIDGGSTDGTLEIVQGFASKIDILISEKDKGMYDALNKGIALATGHVVGVLHADDFFAGKEVLTKVMEVFSLGKCDAVYGNLNYVDRENTSKIIRKWVSKQAIANDFVFGWMPAHPTLYLKRTLFEQYGNYSLNYGSAADYELMLRFLYLHRVKMCFMDYLMINMRVGGMSNQSAKHRKHALVMDYKALKTNKVPFPIVALMLKKLSKIRQFF